MYAAYLRKSRADMELEQNSGIDTLKRHRDIIKQTANYKKIYIDEWYEEVVSGDTIEARPEIQKLLLKVEQGFFEGVFVVDVDRLARGDTADQARISKAFAYSSTLIITPNKVYNPDNEADEEYFEFSLFMSRREYKIINRRLNRGRISSANEGKFVGSVCPYGYTKEKIKGQKGFKLIPLEEEAKIIKIIFNMAGQNIGTSIIANYLNKIGSKPRKSEVWVQASIRSILANPVYYGMIQWNYRKTIKHMENGIVYKSRPKNTNQILVKGLHEAIVTKEEWELANNRYKNKIAKSVKNNLTLQNPLAGLIKCEFCGRTMQRKDCLENKKTKAKLRRKYKIDKEKLRLCLREHKGNYSLSEIAKKLNVSKNPVTHWFATNLKKFTIPYPDKWEELKKILNITTTEFDKSILIFEENINEPDMEFLFCVLPHCKNVGSHLYLIENAIINSLKTILNDYKQMIIDFNEEKKDINTDNSIIEIIKKEIDTTEKQLSKTYDLLEQGLYDTELFSKRNKQLNEKLKNLNVELKKCENEKIENNIEKIKNVIPKIEYLIENYSTTLSPKDRNDLLKSVINKILYKKTARGKGHETEFTLKIDIKL